MGTRSTPASGLLLQVLHAKLELAPHIFVTYPDLPDGRLYTALKPFLRAQVSPAGEIVRWEHLSALVDLQQRALRGERELPVDANLLIKLFLLAMFHNTSGNHNSTGVPLAAIEALRPQHGSHPRGPRQHAAAQRGRPPQLAAAHRAAAARLAAAAEAGVVRGDKVPRTPP